MVRYPLNPQARPHHQRKTGTLRMQNSVRPERGKPRFGRGKARVYLAREEMVRIFPERLWIENGYQQLREEPGMDHPSVPM